VADFEFATANRIIFGAGNHRQTGEIAKDLGSIALIVTGGNSLESLGLLESLIADLGDNGVSSLHFPVDGEPTVEIIDQGLQMAREGRANLVIAVGGGSAMDAGKAIAGLISNKGDLLDHMEVIGNGEPLEFPAVPFIAIPTTAGTGTEVTRNAVIRSEEHKVKASFRSPFLLPKIAVVDPELSYSMPPEVTASTGLDALTQVIEPFVSKRANPMVDALCREGMLRVSRSLKKAFQNGQDVQAREDMAMASLFGGLALSNAGLGAVHGFAGPIGGMYPIPHGIICAALLPHVMVENVRAISIKDPKAVILEKYASIGEYLTGQQYPSRDEAIEAGVGFVQNLCVELNVAGLSAYGFKQKDIPEAAEKATKSSSMKANPVVFTVEELENILKKAL